MFFVNEWSCLLNIKVVELWQARHFVKNSIRNEFVTRVARSRLGLVWIVIYPLAQVAIYAFVLSALMTTKLPGLQTVYAYPIYLTAGILAWTLFAEVVGRCLNVFIENGNLLKKMAFPRLALPAIITGSALLNNTLLFLSVLLVFAILGHVPTLNLLWLPVLTLLLLVLALGLGLTLGLLNVFFRDVGQLVTIALQFGFWLTPIVYTLDLFEPVYQKMLHLNPMTGIVQGYQAILVFGRGPDWQLLMYPTLFAAIAICMAAFLYSRAIDEVVDVL
ncbi:ABC transporter permease [Stutzerimonas stutzeri]|uniref:ABC transporter permease n=1 Tax=Stutzerimonas stutzeri TaxID=316 RepID=UPI00210AA847|nr:ABC transporter permease [Stutzerimonas stutzeri]MCQ4322992.1 ABC transporter permease [Stutzerimonas stutzeri]